MPAPISVVLSVHDRQTRQRLRALLERYRDVVLVAERGSGAETVEAIREHVPQLVVLDAQMPELDAFAVVEAIGADEMPAVVFVTTLDAAVLRVLEVHALPYLLVPFDDNRFYSTLRRAAAHTERHSLAGLRRRLARMLEADEEGSKERRISVRQAGSTQFVDLDDVRWVEAVGSFSRLHLDGRTHVVKIGLDELAARFADDFVRIHSTLVRATEIAEIERTGEGQARVTLRDGSFLRFGENSRPEIVPAP